MTEDGRSAERDVRAANAAFYTALSGLDLGAMDAVWLADEGAVCVHPGREALHGWEAIRASWQGIFGATRWIHVEPTDVGVVVVGDAAVVSCAENITAQADEGVGLASAHATNVFRRVEGSWRLLVHHASPVPGEALSPAAGAPQ